MMKSKSLDGCQGDESPALDISSLIDVCFLLLIYFLVTSTIVPRESDLDMSLPGERPAGPLTKVEPLWIRILSNGQIYTGTPDAMLMMDGDVRSRNLPLLSQHLEMMVAAHRAGGMPTLVQLQADDECDHQRVIDVLNALAAKKIQAVTFTDLLGDV